MRDFQEPGVAPPAFFCMEGAVNVDYQRTTGNLWTEKRTVNER